MEVLAVILGRKGSKRLPNKNRMSLLGRPILSYTLDHIKESKLITRTVINTDDEQLEAVAKEAGIESIPRLPELSTDESVSTVVTKATVLALQEKENYKPDIVLELYPNCPVRPPNCFDICIGALLEHNADSVFALSKVKHTVFRDSSGFVQYPASTGYMMNGAVFVIRTKVLIAGTGEASVDYPEGYDYFGKRCYGVVFELSDAIELDLPEELVWAEHLLRRQKAHEEAHPGRVASTSHRADYPLQTSS